MAAFAFIRAQAAGGTPQKLTNKVTKEVLEIEVDTKGDVDDADED